MEEFNKIFSLFKRNFGAIVLFGVLIAALSFLLLVVKEKNFRVTTEYLVVQDQALGPQDFSSVSKSVEHISKVMNEAIYSELFIEEIVKTRKVGEEFLPFNKKDKLEDWSKMVKVNRDSELGILRVSVLNDNQSEALSVSEGIIEVLTKKNYLFRGSGQDVDFRILSGPIIERNPSIGGIILVVIGGFLAGGVISFSWKYYRNEIGYISELDEKIQEIQKRELNDPVSPEEYEESLKYFEEK